MADRRRRKLDDEGEEEGAASVQSTGETESTNGPVLVRRSECESEGETESADVDLSEYESAVDAEEKTEDGSETETEEESSDTEDGETETGSDTEEAYTDEEGLEERQSGDGEEQPDKDKPDDDEDKKNPAYVPRKGAFYEHDFRQGESPEGEEATDQQPKKKLWQDEAKWAHDKYDADTQAPKSREELIAIYGYDIRAADKPPEAPPQRARRGRRGGGPRREQRMQDFIPRMAVIDTTEDGTDSVPNLGDDGLILYEGPRHSRGARTRHGEGRRGRGGSRMEVPRYEDNGERDDQSERKQGGYSAPSDQGRKVEIRSQDVRTMNDYPSLEESRQQQPYRDQRKDDRKPDNNRFERSVSDEGKRYGRREEYDNNRGGRGNYEKTRGGRGDYANNRGGRVEYDNNRRGDSQNGYRGEDSKRGRGGGQYQQDRRGGYNKRGRESGRQQSRADQGDWRTSQTETRARFGDEDGNRGGRGYDFRGQDQSSDWRRNDQGYDGNDSKRGGYSSYEQPPRYQQQKQQVSSGTDERREFTNTAYKSNEEYKKSRVGSGNNTTTTGVVTEAGDANTLSSKNLVISNKENVQTINVTITSTTTEKKSYAKERRAKGTGGSSRTVEAVPQGLETIDVKAGVQYPGVSQPSLDPTQNTAGGAGGAKRYSSQRQQVINKGAFTEPPPVDAGAKLYNPALPPPSFFQRDQGTAGQRGAPPVSVQDTTATHFPPPLLPPTAALPFGLPASSTGIPLPPNTVGLPVNPSMFQPPRGPPPTASIPAGPGQAVIPSPYLPTGLIYSGPGPRVPPPGAPSGFPMPLAYTSPPPTTPVSSTASVQPPQQGAGTQQGPAAANQPKKVYRGDITYYAPELQQPSRTPQKRPKAAIPIVDPQEIRRQKQKEKMEARNTPERYSSSPSKQSEVPKVGRAITGSFPSEVTDKETPSVQESNVVCNVPTSAVESHVNKSEIQSEANFLSLKVQAEVEKELSAQVDKMSAVKIESSVTSKDLPSEEKVKAESLVDIKSSEKSGDKVVIVPPDKQVPAVTESSSVVSAESS